MNSRHDFWRGKGKKDSRDEQNPGGVLLLYAPLPLSHSQRWLSEGGYGVIYKTATLNGTLAT